VSQRDLKGAELHEFGTNALISELRRRGDLGLAIREAAQDLDGYRRALVGHHNIANLSDAVLANYDYRECPVCKEARGI
jgi:hypothetical protein